MLICNYLEKILSMNYIKHVYKFVYILYIKQKTDNILMFYIIIYVTNCN